MERSHCFDAYAWNSCSAVLQIGVQYRKVQNYSSRRWLGWNEASISLTVGRRNEPWFPCREAVCQLQEVIRGHDVQYPRRLRRKYGWSCFSQYGSDSACTYFRFPNHSTERQQRTSPRRTAKSLKGLNISRRTMDSQRL